MRILENISDYHIILGSNSPRRKELLAGLDIPFEVKVVPDVDESYPYHLYREEIPLFIAGVKADAYLPFLKSKDLLITADTIVWLNGNVYGKPGSPEEAVEMLKTLSGNVHEVITGVCITSLEKQQRFFSVSKVKFASLDENEIAYYIRKYLPYDKAGSYGVQEWIGYIGVESLEGSFYNVMGLPASMLYKHLKDW